MSARDGDDAQDDALWRAVAKTVTPLRKARTRPRARRTVAEPEKTPPQSAKPKLTARGQVSTPSAFYAPALPPLASLDRRTRGRIARGNAEIEGRLDLHGHRLDEARHRLLDFLNRAQDCEKSLVLVITGKGTVAPKGMERGVLKREVPLWLGSAEFRRLVIGFEEAASRHGGSGALYVRVRRKR
jgi:DNA-nicking Smr family endonuclease